MKDQLVLFARSDSPYKTLDHVLKAQEPPKCGASGVGSSGYLLPKIVEEVTGAKFTIIRGYQGGKESDLAVERGELPPRLPRSAPATRRIGSVSRYSKDAAKAASLPQLQGHG